MNYETILPPRPSFQRSSRRPVSSRAARAFGGGLGILAGFVLLLGCDSSSEKPAAPPARYEAAMVEKKTSAKELEAFCDARDTGTLALPALSGDVPKADGAQWVNVWATWCKACVEEMPMIERWKGKLGASVLFISSDEDEEILASYRKEHPNTPPSTRMEKPDELTEWLKKWGLDAGAGLPVHLFVGGDGKIRCVRAGAVAEHHYELVAQLLDG